MARHRSHSIEFKSQVAQEYLGGVRPLLSFRRTERRRQPTRASGAS